MKALVKTAFIMLVLCLASQEIFAQDKSTSKVIPIEEMQDQSKKDELIRKYPWVKSHFANKEKQPTKVSELLGNGAYHFVIIETENNKILYDKEGNTYCTDLEALDRSGFYEFSPGHLHWSRS